MPFYMLQARYTAAALKAMVDNPQDREAAARPLVEAVGGKLHHLFFCFGAEDVVALIEAPDDKAMAASAFSHWCVRRIFWWSHDQAHDGW
jgi:uncharacterized protein with GYD domain